MTPDLLTDIDVLVRLFSLSVAAVLLTQLLRRRSPAWAHFGAVAALAALLALPTASTMLPELTITLPLLEAPAPRASAAQASTARVAPEAEGSNHIAPRTESANSTTTNPSPSTTALSSPGAELPSLPSLLTALWLIVAGALISRLGFGIFALRGLAREAKPAPPALTRLLAGLVDKGQRMPELQLVDELATPMVWGLNAPQILLPSQALEWNQQRLKLVLRHELAHLERGDWPSLMVARAAVAIYWFNPLIWWLERTARLESERACDDHVLATGLKPSTYAAELVAIAAEGRSRGAGLALAMARPKDIEMRIERILDPVAARRRPGKLQRALAWSAAAAALITVAAVQPQAISKPAGDPIAAQRATINDNYEAAEAYVFTSDGDDGEDWWEEAYEHHGEQRWEQAIKAFERARDLDYRPASSAYNIACGHARLGHVGEALQWLDIADDEGFDIGDYLYEDSDLDPIRADSGFRALLARYADEHGMPDRLEMARGDYAEMLEEGSMDGEAFYEIGSDLLATRQLDDARRALEHAIELLGDDSSNARYNLACAEALAGREAAALEWLESAILNGFSNHEHMLRDADLDSLSDNPRFEELAKLAFDLSPQEHASDHWGWNDHRSAKRWASAIEHFESFTSERPEIGRGWHGLGWSLLLGERPGDAEQAFARAADLGYQVALSRYNQACSAALAGSVDRAFGHLTDAIAAGFDGFHHMSQDDDLEPLHDDPRWDALLEKYYDEDEHGWRKEMKKHKKELKRHFEHNRDHVEHQDDEAIQA